MESVLSSIGFLPGNIIDTLTNKTYGLCFCHQWKLHAKPPRFFDPDHPRPESLNPFSIAHDGSA